LGVAFKNVELDGLHPAAALHERHDSLCFNLGDKPFCWDLIGFVRNKNGLAEPDPSLAQAVDVGEEDDGTFSDSGEDDEMFFDDTSDTDDDDDVQEILVVNQ